MPSPAPQARRVSKQQDKSTSPTKANAKSNDSEDKPKGLDLGKTIGLYDTATVREKVRKWQTTGGGVLVEQDVLAVDSDIDEIASSPSSGARKAGSETKVETVDPPKVEVIDAPATPTSPQPVESVPVLSLPTPRVVEAKPARNKLNAEIRQAIAPKKRLVSDGHWRVTRPPPKPAPKPVKPTRPTKQEKEKDQQFAWVRAPLLPRKPDEPPSPPKPKPAPKPIKIYSARPRTKSFNIVQSDETLSEDDLPRTRKPETLQKKAPARASQPGPEKTTRAYKSDEENLPKRARPSHRRRMSRQDDRSSSPDEYRMSGALPPRADQKSPGDLYSRRIGNRRRSSSVEDFSRRREVRSRERPPVLQKSPVTDFSDGESKARRKSSRRHERKIHAQLSDEEPNLPFRRLSNHDEEAARRRSTFRDEYARYSPKETYSSERKRGSRRKTSYVEPNLPEPVGTVMDVDGSPRVSSRVEAWLTETPVLGKEGGPSKRVFSFEPLRRDLDASTESTVDTETTITETTITEPRDRHKRISSRGNQHGVSGVAASKIMDRSVRARSDSLDKLDPEIEIEYSSTTSVPTLHRKGAQRGSLSPTKDRLSSHSRSPSLVESDVTSSVLTSSIGASSVDPSVFDLRDVRVGKSFGVFADKRFFPSTGKRLSTIASVDTFNTKIQQAAPSLISEVSESVVEPSAGRSNDTMAGPLPLGVNSVVSSARSKTSLKRKLTTHADLISVLSLPASRSKSIVSARSIRTHRSRLETATIEDLMSELTSDEVKYMRELRTLADGVIPVLLKCVLSKSEAAVAAGLFNRFPNSEKDAIADASKAIHDMSVAIQRLKSLHTRIPKDNHFSFLIWAQGAHTIYENFVKTWRLGFQDVVVSLASEDGPVPSAQKSPENGPWDQGLPRNEEGYVVDGDGERVDVAFLLKRPLVRLKYLTKTLKGINIKKPSDQADLLATKFQGLMDVARERVNEEKARLEDEAAALIDATRARDPKSLAPLAGVKIDSTRRVRARDFFDLSLPHSSGQQMDCRVEILLRDDAPGRGNSGDALICEVDETGRWLLFPPIQFSRISSRAGDEPGEIVAMIQGVYSGGREWQELLTLTTHDEEVRFDWIQMLGVSPVPPSLTILARNRSFKITVDLAESSHGSSVLSGSSRTESTVPIVSREPSPRQIEVPIGERAGTQSKRWDYEESDISDYTYSTVSSHTSLPSSEGATLFHKQKSPDRSLRRSWDSNGRHSLTPIQSEPVAISTEQKSPCSDETTPRNLNEAMALAGSGSPTPKRNRAKRYRALPTSSIARDVTPSSIQDKRRSLPLGSTHSPNPPSPGATYDGKKIPMSPGTRGFSVWMPPSSEAGESDSSEHENDFRQLSSSSDLPTRAAAHTRSSSVPLAELRTVSRRTKLGDELQIPQTPSKMELRGVSLPVTSSKEIPATAPLKLHKNRSRTDEDADEAPPPPPHRTPSSNRVKFAPTPQFTPTSQLKRRSSSPLKHEYQPSSASSSSILSDDSETDYSDETLSSDSENGFDDDDDDIISSLVPPSLVSRRKPADAETTYSTRNATITPSQSASQAVPLTPYRAVPKQSDKAAKTISTIFCWSDRGQWELLHPNECNILISPGLIEAFEIESGQADDRVPKDRPLVALELTPLVPLRRGTALDITIRSPPISSSRLKSGNNIMFRSRSTEECEALYALINTSRINNPTYLALQSARPQAESTWGAVMDRRNSQRGNNGATGASGSWWQFGGSSRSKSYRASNRASSTGGNTDSSVATISSVVAAMKRFSGSGRIFDAAKSRMSRSGASSGSMGSGRSGAHSPTGFVDPETAVPIGLGITNAKIRLYMRQNQGSKWADLGSARLSIMQRELDQDVLTPIMLQTGAEKRIIVVGKSKAEIMLDATLGESCFERVARTGIAVSVWEDVVPEGHGVAATGGVAEKRVKIYMIQLKSERECAYTFSLLGKLRY